MTYMKLAMWKMIVMELINFALYSYNAILSWNEWWFSISRPNLVSCYTASNPVPEDEGQKGMPPCPVPLALGVF